MIKKYFRHHTKLLMCIILAIIIITTSLLALATPSTDKVLTYISNDIQTSSGTKYAESSVNLIIVSVARGKNVKTGQEETYIGFANKIYKADEGLLHTLSDILLWLPALWEGTKITIALAITSTLAGILLSFPLAVAKMSHIKPIKIISEIYIYIFRGSPLLMQLFFIYYALPQINDCFIIENKFVAAFIAYSLNLAAYFAEIVRAAIESIDKGQWEAAKALNLTKLQTLKHVIIPQAFLRLLPPAANQFIMSIKDVSLVSLIALADLTQVTRSISSSTGSALVFIPSVIIYLVLSGIFTVIFSKLEKRYSYYL